MSKEIDDVLLEMEKRDMVAELLQSYGATYEQADLATAPGSKVLKEFNLSAGGSVLCFQRTPIMASENGAPVKAWLEANKYTFLLAPKAEATAQDNIEPDLIAKARAGNVTARGAIWRELHGDKPRTAEAATTAALEKLLAGEAADEKKPADKIAAKGFNGSNPWRAESWNITKQGELVKKLGEEAAAGIAKSAFSFLGAAHPTKAA
jgi:hypothetical protein